ncbi:MAG: hypothetical protein V4674_02045 [Patescibacteria group bacterium]
METNTELSLDVGQANELKLAFRRTGWTNAEIKMLCEGSKLRKVLLTLRGWAEISVPKVDLSASPSLYSSLAVVQEHEVGPQHWEWDPGNTELYVHQYQRKGWALNTVELRKELAGRKTLNACLIDFLLAHPHLIPPEWESWHVLFLGTTYRDVMFDVSRIRYLYRKGTDWKGGDVKVGDHLNDRYRALLVRE